MSVAEQIPQGMNRPVPEVLDVLLDIPIATKEGILNLRPVTALHEHLGHALGGQTDWEARRSVAIDYSQYLHDELSVDQDGLNYHQRVNLSTSKLYLSNVAALGRLGEFLNTMRWTGKKSQESDDSKTVYLEARKVVQDDIDSYYDQIVGLSPDAASEGLVDIANLARLLNSGKEFVNHRMYSLTHVFIGSILSERLVMVSLQDNVDPAVRYGTAEEDRSPTKADVVLPTDNGDLYVQVKMKWKRPTDLRIKPKKKPMHVIVPMRSLRGSLSSDESRMLAQSVREKSAELAA